jgi:hypothetical protein
VQRSIDEEARSSLDAISDSAGDIRLNPRQALAIREIGPKPFLIEADVLGVGRQVVIRQRTLPPKQQVVHIPELSLELGRLRSQGGM